MERAQLEEKVIKIVAEQLDFSSDRAKEIKPETKLFDLDADALDRIEITMACEEEFGLELTDEEADKLEAVKDLVDLIESKTKKEE